VDARQFEAVKRAAYAVGPSTVILSAGLAMHSRPEMPLVALSETALAVGAGYIGLKHGWPIAWIFAGGFGYAALTTVFGLDLMSMVGWAAATGAGLGLRLWFEHKFRHGQGQSHSQNIDRLMKESDLRYKMLREQATEARNLKTLASAGMALPNALALTHGAMNPALMGNILPPGAAPIGTEEAAIRQAIRACYGQELLACSVESSERGYRAVVSLPPMLPRERLRREWERVRGALAATGRYDLEDGEYDNQLVIRFNSGNGFPDRILYLPGNTSRMVDPVYLGPDVDGQDTFLQMLGRHTLLLGTSGNGKSNIMNLLLLAAIQRGAAVIGVDMKKGVELAPISPLLVTLATTGEQAREVFDWLDAETDRRAEIMIREGIRKWSEEFGPYIILAIDELSELTDKKYKVEGLPNLAELNASASRIYRAFGVYLVAATQAPSKQAFGGNTDARTNYKNRIATRCEEAAHAAFGFGASWKSDGWDPNGILKDPGEFLLANAEHSRPIRRKSPEITDEALAEEVQRLLPQRVDLDGSPWGESGVALTVDTRVLNLLRNRGDVTRKDIEEGLRLDGKQVRNAVTRLRARKGINIEYDQEAGVYRMATPDPRELVPAVLPPE
jgi:hypothetical protein